MDECEYDVIDVDQRWLVGRMGDAPARDLALEFDREGWELVATIAQDCGRVRVVFQRARPAQLA